MQINRMFEIIYILLDKKTVTAGELAQRFEVSTRTIYRDIETLSAAGIPVYMSKGKGGGISILGDFVLNKTVLTEEEKSDVLSSLYALEAVSFHESDSALQKLSSLFGGGNADWIEVDFSSWYNAKEESEIFYQVKSAILSHHTLRFTYASGKKERTIREVEPLKICFKGMARYLYGFCTLRGDYRFFKLTRMKDCEITEEKFQRKVTEPVFQKNIILEEKIVELKLKLSKEMAYRVYDEFESYEKQEDGSFLVKVRYPLNDWLFPYIMSFGSNCQVLEPFEIRNKVKKELEKTLKCYL